MVSSCALYLDDVELTANKAFVPDSLSAIFQESDRVEGRDLDDTASVIYRASRSTVLLRLSLLGCTEALGKRCFEEWKQALLAEAEENETEDEPDHLRALTWDEWRRRVPEVLWTYYDDDSKDEIDRRMKDDDYSSSWLWFDGLDSLISLCAIISACVEVRTIALDVGPLIHGGWINSDEAVCGDRVRVVSRRGEAAGPTIILAEGKSDITLLKAAIHTFHPEAADFLTFLDHTEFRVDGGASYVVKFLKAFAAARVPSNVVAIFDNDTAGLVALQAAKNLGLPPNLVCIHLPDTDLARHYPTIGPQGFHHADVNGRAAGIELYLGKAALSVDGALRPVRWTGYDQNAAKYQGEVEGKLEVQKAFLDGIRGDTEISLYPELRSLLNVTLEAVSQAAEMSQSRARRPLKW